MAPSQGFYAKVYGRLVQGVGVCGCLNNFAFPLPPTPIFQLTDVGDHI